VSMRLSYDISCVIFRSFAWCLEGLAEQGVPFSCSAFLFHISLIIYSPVVYFCAVQNWAFKHISIK
jgi:hypothetical protein